MPDVHSGSDALRSRIELDLPRVPQQARSRRKRDALLAAALRLFAERGYEATTADDIAAVASVSIGTFYAYFRNKHQLFLTLYVEHCERILALEIGAIDFSTDPRQAIRATVQRAMRTDESLEGLRRAIQELLPRDPQLAAYEEEQRQAIYQQILAAARKIEAQGLTWPGIDIEATCWMITTLIKQFPLLMAGAEIQRERRVRALVDLIYHALFRA